MATAAERMKRMVERRKADGLCPRCGELNDRLGIGGYECSYCKDSQNSIKREWVKEQLANGVCPNCRGKMDRKGWNCSKCHAKVLELNKKNRNKQSA